MEDWETERELSRIERSEETKRIVRETLLKYDGKYSGELSTMQCLAIVYYNWKADKKPISDLFYMLSEVSTIVDGMVNEVKEEREKRFWERVNKNFEEYLKRKEGK